MDYTNTTYKKNTLKSREESNETLNNQEDMLNNLEEMKSNIEMPPQRDIRDAQPTISVNYRVVKNTEENDLKRDKNYSNNPDYRDDWDNQDNDW